MKECGSAAKNQSVEGPVGTKDLDFVLQARGTLSTFSSREIIRSNLCVRGITGSNSRMEGKGG